MATKVVRVIVTGKARQAIDVDLMAQAIMALGRELAARGPKHKQRHQPRTDPVSPVRVVT